MINNQRLLETFLHLVQLDSESRNERSVADYVTQQLIQAGFQVKEDNTGEKIGGNAGNIIAYKPATVAGKSILFGAHMDTVAPGCDVQPIIDQGVIYSNGNTVLGGDDKSGIAIVLEMAKVIQQQQLPHGEIQVLFTVAEEGGLHGAKNLDCSQLQPVHAAFMLDSSKSPGDIIITAPTQMNITITFQGKAAHAGVAPENGINAIQMAGQALADMPLGRISETTTANIGIIQGGMSINIVPDNVTLIGEARSFTKVGVEKQINAMQHACEQAVKRYGGTVSYLIEESYAAIGLDHDCFTVQLAQQAIQSVGLTPQLIATGGGSDANILNGYGIETTNLGMGMSNVHSTEEYLKIEDLETMAQVVLALVEQAIDH